MINKFMSIFVICALVLLLAANKAGARVVPEGWDSTVFRAIQNGGYILYLRHGEATIGQDQPELNFSDCGTQRNLSEFARNQARAIGNMFSKYMIPIRYPVMSSPYCRTRETAEIMFGQQNVVIMPLLASIGKLQEEDFPIEKKQKILADLSKIFETPPAYGTNTVIVAHSFPKNIALGEIPNMGTVVIKPKGKGHGYEIVSRINFEDFIKWTNNSASGSRLEPFKFGEKKSVQQ